jgi:hypothetical protein
MESTLTKKLGDAGFKRVGGQHDVEVYQNEQSPVVELAAVGRFEAPPSVVQAALLDYTAHTRVNPQLVESVVLERTAGEQLVYQHLELPVIKDRDYTLRVTWDEGAANGLRFTIDGSRHPATTEKFTRLERLTGSWELSPGSDGRSTEAYYHIELDIGSIPRWMVAGGAAKDLPSLFVGIRTLIAPMRDRLNQR